MGIYCVNLGAERLGEISINTTGERMQIIAYRNARDMDVRFLDTGYETKAEYAKFKAGNIRDPLYPLIYGKAYFGVGLYESRTPAYKKWFQMIRRCYDPAWQGRTYEDATVCDEWLNYQNFAEWYENNPPYDETYHLDKDLLGGKLKHYSPETCCWLPKELNSMITKNEAIRGNCPIGVSEIPHMPGKYIARLTDNYRITGKTYLFYKQFDSKEEAFRAYRSEKLKFVKSQAEKYRQKLDEKVYQALLHWDIDETD